MKCRIMNTVTTIFSVIAVLLSVFSLLYTISAIKDDMEASSNSTSITETSEEAIISHEEELRNFKAEKRRLDKEAIGYLEIIPSLKEMSPALLEQLDDSASKNDILRAAAKEELSPKVYSELQEWIENDHEWWSPTVKVAEGYKFQYSPEQEVDIYCSNGKFVIKEDYYRWVAWAENINIPSNNRDLETERVYEIIDTTKPAYILAESVETPLQLFIIENNSSM